MKKIIHLYRRKPATQKILLTMRLTLFLLVISVFSAFSSTYAQKTKLDINVQNSSVKDVLNEIETQSEFFFMYNNKQVDVERKVDLDAKSTSVDVVLQKLFAGTDVNFKVVNRQILLFPKDLINLAEQQGNKVTGKVTDQTGLPIPGASVIVKGTTTGVTTDNDGKFSLAISPEAKVLVISFVGMRSQEIVIGGKTTFNTVLEEETIGIEEVVAIGYGSVKKSDLTGAIGSIKGDVIANRKTTQISQALQGTVPGLMVTRNNNAPGATATIRIRGITTIGENNPLIILDGVPVDDINSVNPNDVENISVLKDAASASIYGSRAAAGVILVTTKRAKSGQLALEYNMEYGFEKPTEMPGYVNAVTFMKHVNELRWNDNNNNANEYPTYTKDIVDNYTDLNAQNPDLYPNTDWRGLIMNNNAPRQSHILSITAGTKAIKTKASLAYDKTDALYDARTYERLTARFNNDITINNYLTATIDFNFKRSISKQPVVDPMYKMGVVPPIYAAMWSDGRVGAGKDGANIYGQMKYGGTNDNYYNTVGGKISIDFTPFSGLKLSGVVSPTYNFDKGKKFALAIPYTAYNNPGTISGYLEGAKETTLNEVRNDSYRVTYQFITNYTKTFGLHNVNAMVGYEYYSAFNENLSASRGQYGLTSYPYLNIGPLILRDNSGDAYENAYRSYFGRIMYNYQNKYFLQGNIRYDGSSRFHQDYRWGSFPSFSAGWVLSEESFMKDQSTISFLKFRGSWGTLGNERIGNYPYQAALNFETNSLFYQGNTAVSAQSAAQWQYAIRDISWEKTESVDFGIDANFFDNRLRFTGDYYKKTTKDMLLQLQIPIYLGFDNPNQNTGKMNTKGWEFEIGWNDKIGNLDYAISANISDFTSVMGDLGGTEFLGDQIKREGSEFNEWYGYLSEGLYQTQADVDASAKLNSNVKPGDVRYKDISGPTGEPDGKISPEYDRVLLGGSLPHYMYGANLSIGYKNFDLSVVVQGVGQQNVRLNSTMVQPLLENYGNFPSILEGNYWSKYNTDDQNLVATYPRFTNTSAGNNYTMSDFWLFDGAYFRVKNITLGYNVPKFMTDKVRLQSVRLYTTVSDLFSINNYPKGWDPEMSSTAYPITTSFIFGVSVKF